MKFYAFWERMGSRVLVRMYRQVRQKGLREACGTLEFHGSEWPAAKRKLAEIAQVARWNPWNRAIEAQVNRAQLAKRSRPTN